jgi:predicted alpha-1,6-mannanase (GH76 family)
MAKNWKPEKGGGVMWSEDPDKQRPNTITNGLFLILSARLHQRTRDATYLRWAEKTLGWMRGNALYDGIAVVDAPGHVGDYWTYNQGVFIGGLTALYQDTGQRAYLDDAVKATEGILHRSGLTQSTGIIIEKLGTNGDASLFKGVFVRYLAQLRDVLNNQKLYPDLAEEISRCIGVSVQSLLRHGVGTDGLFTAEWHEMAKDRTTSFKRQVSGLAALVVGLSPRPER